MWNRAQLKDKAKQVLRGSYWKAFLVSLILSLSGGGSSGGGGGGKWNLDNKDFKEFQGDVPGQWGDTLLYLLPFIVIIGVIVFALVLGFRIFLGYPLEIGSKRFFVKSAQTKADFNHIGFIFEKGRYLSAVKTMLCKGIFTFLWLLVFIIPGIVKSYAYSMVPYILGENPTIGYKRALALSQDMTKGHKWNMFVLDLSFIGWYLLGLLALVVGMLFVLPYDYSTKAQLYLALRENALNQNLCTHDELLIPQNVMTNRDDIFE